MEKMVFIPEAEFNGRLRQLEERIAELESFRTTTAQQESERILTSAEAAHYLGITVFGVRKARREGRLRAVAIDERSWGFRRRELERYLHRHDRPR